jgi:hypothetical protein
VVVVLTVVVRVVMVSPRQLVWGEGVETADLVVVVVALIYTVHLLARRLRPHSMGGRIIAQSAIQVVRLVVVVVLQTIARVVVMAAKALFVSSGERIVHSQVPVWVKVHHTVS